MREHRSSEFGTAMAGLVGIAILIAAVYFLAVAQFSGGGGSGTPEQIAARISPVGAVNLAGQAPTAPAATEAPSAAADEGPGKGVYNNACVACHASGAAGAPILGDKAAWEPRMAQGLEKLVQTAIAGKGAMPPRGTCMDCSDDDLKLAIEYILVEVGYELAPSSDAGTAEAAEGMSGM